MKINENIFRAYDIRGLYPEEINNDTAEQVAKALAKFLNAKKIVVGRDMRESSKDLHKAFVTGLLEMGVKVYDIGLSSTPMLYFAPTFLKADGAVMITASHNPMNYGGIKFTDSRGYPIFVENGLSRIKTLSLSDITTSKKKGKLKKVNINKDYLKYLQKETPKFKNFKVVVDAMHGSMGPIAKKVFNNKNLKVKCISCTPNSKLPGYKTPNPRLSENRKNIIKTIKKEKADLGIMFDGDGDRMVVIDSKGERVSPNFIATIVIKELIGRNKKFKVVGDVRASRVVSDIVKEKGGKYFSAKAGNPYVKAEMIKRNAIFGFETTGHLFFRGSNYAEDSIKAVMKLLSYLSSVERTPQEVFDEFKSKYHIAEEVNFKTEDSNVLNKISKRYKGGKITKLDGLTIKFTDYRFNIRKSNTESLIRLNMEANSKEILEGKKKEFIDFITSIGGKLSDH